MITQIEIHNFKSIKNQSLDNIPKIVAIWGINGSGKSSLIQSIIWSLKNRGDPSGNGLFFRGPLDYTYGHDINNVCEVAITYKGERYECIIQQNKWRRHNPPDSNLARTIRYFPPWRQILSRYYPIQNLTTDNLALNGERIHSFMHDFLHKLENRMIRGDKSAKKLYDQISKYSDKVGFGALTDERMGERVTGKYYDKILDLEIPIVDGGFGGNSFLPILLEGFSITDGIMLIEEPEISLHPAAQSELWDFFIEMVNERNNQVIFTSHSEYLAKRIARSYKKEEVDENMVLPLLAEKTPDEGTVFSKIPKNVLIERLDKKKDIIPELTRRT